MGNAEEQPLRLLYVGDQAKDPIYVRLCKTTGLGRCLQYATLSHCWGGQQPTRLLSSNYNDFERGVPRNTLSKVFQDAILVTRRAGLRYLWIDSLCIVQDSNDDWLTQSSNMHCIYKNATFNIAATGFIDGQRGLFVDRNIQSISPAPIIIGADIIEDGKTLLEKGNYFVIPLSNHQWKLEVDEAPLNLRAWVLQERILSSRTIHFGAKQLYWECHQFEACELYPHGFPSLLYTTHIKALSPFGGFRSLILDSDKDTKGDTTWDIRYPSVPNSSDRALEYWYKVMEAYSGGKLTFETDKMHALAGLAKLMSKHVRSRYLAGMWQRHLLHQLVWYVRADCEMGNWRPWSYRCPSWSWMGVDHFVHLATNHPAFDEAKLSPGLEILAVEVETNVSGDIFGGVRSGYLRVKCALRPFQAFEASDQPVSTIAITQTPPNRSVTLFMDSFVPGGPTGHATYAHYIPYESKEMASAESRVTNVLLIPIRTEPFLEDPVLSGLILSPTGKSRGEFVRIGLFESKDAELLRDWKGATQRCELEDLFYEEDHGNGLVTITIV